MGGSQFLTLCQYLGTWTEVWWPFCPTRSSSSREKTPSWSCDRERWRKHELTCQKWDMILFSGFVLLSSVFLSLSFGSMLISGSEVASSVDSSQSGFSYWQRSHCGAEAGKRNLHSHYTAMINWFTWLDFYECASIKRIFKVTMMESAQKYWIELVHWFIVH